MDHTMISFRDVDKHCEAVYHSQQPLHIRTNKRHFAYISVYKNEGDLAKGSPSHWHYVTHGLSDIYGHSELYQLYLDLRNTNSNPPQVQQIYPLRTCPTEKELLSGFGIELTFRVKCNLKEEEPPKWPGSLLQQMAKYVFETKNVFSYGDNTAFKCPLDGESESRIRHLVMTLDPQLTVLKPDRGKIEFIQLVGVCEEELQAAREWEVDGILNIMKRYQDTGGEYLVTDMTRSQSIFEIDHKNHLQVTEGSASGSDITSITARHMYCSHLPEWFKEAESPRTDDENNHDITDIDNTPYTGQMNHMPGVERGNFSTMLRENNNQSTSLNHQSNIPRNSSRISYESEFVLLLENLRDADTKFYDELYLLLDYHSARLLPIVLARRLAHKRLFRYKNPRGDLLTTFIPENCETLIHDDSLVHEGQPFARRGIMLQIYVCEKLRHQMLETLEADLSEKSEQPLLPKNYSWPNFRLHITVVDRIKDST